MPGRAPSAPRCAAIVGPYSSGKTSLLESLLHVTGALSKKGTAKEKTLLGDSSPEARARGLSVETTAAQAEFLGERWTFLDCPGAVELSQDMRNAVLASDVAIVVAEPQTEKALTLAPIFKFLDDNKVLVAKLNRQRGGACYVESETVFRYLVNWGGKRLMCSGSLYKDAASAALGDLRDKVLMQAKKICETLAL